MNISKTILTSIIGLGALTIQAQNSLYVKDSKGVETSFPLTEINKITFPTGNMVINKSDKSESTFALADVARMSFVKTITAIPTSTVLENGVKVFPNPVVEALQITFLGTDAKVSILDNNGNVVKTETLSSNGTINVADLANGMYVCSVVSGGKVDNVKFVK